MPDDFKNATANSKPSWNHSRLILASSSPRRRELLTQAGYVFEVVPPADDVECGVCSESGPAGLVADLAYRKAAAVMQQLKSSREPTSLTTAQSNALILAADTVAECDGFILGKPRDEDDARAMLTKLSGREHRVLTGVCLMALYSNKTDKAKIPAETQKTSSIQPLIRVDVTRLEMDALTCEQLEEYLDSGAWEGKAGAFGYQDRLGWVRIVEGSESNVVGLPLELLEEMLSDFPNFES